MIIYCLGSIPVTDELYHHGIKGQKWGIRRYQNEDGSLTAEGLRRYGNVENFNKIQDRKIFSKHSIDTRKELRYERSVSRGAKLYNKGYTSFNNVLKTFAKATVGYVAVTTAASLGAKWLYDNKIISEDTAYGIVTLGVSAGAVGGVYETAKGIKRGVDITRYKSSGRWKDKGGN